MANGIEVAKAYVTIVPSMEGSQKTIAAELGAVTSEASEKAGSEGGSKFGKSFATGIKVAGATIGAALAATTAAVVAGGKAFVNAAQDVAAYGNEIDKESQKLGISAQAYQEWDFIMQHAGASIDGMKTAMKKLVTEAQNGSDAFEALGLSQEQVANMSQEDLFYATISALQDMESQEQRTALASQLLGKQAMELGPLFNMSSAELEEMRQQAHELGAVMSDEAVASSAQFQDSLQNVQASLSGLKNNMMSEFLPSMSTVMDGLASIFSGSDIDGGLAKIESGVQELANNLVAKAPQIFAIGGSIVKALTTSIVTNLPALLDAALPILTDFITMVVDLAPQLVDAVFQLINGLLDWLVNGEGLSTILNGIVQLTVSITNALAENIGTIIPMVVGAILEVINTLTSPEVVVPMIQAGISLLLELVKGILSAIPQLIAAIPVIIENIVNTLLEGLPLIIEAAIQIFMALVDAIPVIIEALVQALPSIINTIIDAVLNAIPLLLQAAIQLLMALIQAIPTIILTLVQELPKIITTIIETLLSRLPDLIMGAIQLFMGIIQAIPTIIVELIKALPQIIVALVKGLISGIGELAKAGLELMKGLVNGIANAAKFVWEKIKSFCSGIVDKIKGFFGIHSPSTLFRDQIGENLALGLDVGFTDEMGTVTDDMVDSLDDMTKAMETNIESNGIAGAEMINGDTNIGGSTIAINVYGAEGQNVEDLAEQVAYKLEDLTRRKEAVYV